jgi:hypothetical protein
LGFDGLLDRAMGMSLAHLSELQHPVDGGFYGTVNLLPPVRRGDRPFLFTEVTAYSVELLLRLQEAGLPGDHLERALKAGSSCLARQYSGERRVAVGAYHDRLYVEDGEPSGTFYSYPNAVVVAALADLYAAADRAEHLNSALRCLEWLMDVMYFSDGRAAGFRESLLLDADAPSGPLYPYEAICIPVMLLTRERVLGGFTSDQREKLWSSIRWGLSTQLPDGAFPLAYGPRGGRMDRRVYSHFSLYPSYNLMNFPLYDLSTKLGFAGAELSLRRALSWALSSSDAEGAYYAFYEAKALERRRPGPDVLTEAVPTPLCSFRQTPATAQAANVLLHISSIVGDDRMKAAGLRSLGWLCGQLMEDGPCRGGLPWIVPDPRRGPMARRILYLLSRWSLTDGLCGALSVDFEGKSPTWATQFLVDALLRSRS